MKTEFELGFLGVETKDGVLEGCQGVSRDFKGVREIEKRIGGSVLIKESTRRNLPFLFADRLMPKNISFLTQTPYHIASRFSYSHVEYVFI